MPFTPDTPDVPNADAPNADAPNADGSHPAALAGDPVGDAIAELCAHLDAGLYRLLTLLRTYDEEELWSGWRSCAHWAELAHRDLPCRGPRAAAGGPLPRRPAPDLRPDGEGAALPGPRSGR